MSPSSAAPETLPIITIAPYLPTLAANHSDTDRAATAKALHEACRDIGFLYLNVDGFVSPDEMQNALDLAREFFHRPQEEKDDILLTKADGARGELACWVNYHPLTCTGYQRLRQNVTMGKADHHEGLDMYAPSPFPDTPENAKRHLGGANQYPVNPPALKPLLEDWIVKMKTLGEAVMHGMCDGLGMDEKEWQDMWAINNDSFWSMRLIGELQLGS